MNQRSNYSSANHSKTGTDRQRTVTTSSGITIDKINQNVNELDTKITVLNTQTTNEITELKEKIKLLEKIIKNLVNIDLEN